MSLPELLSGAVGDEEVVARVPLGGDDVLAVTSTRTVVYRADGLLSDESVETYDHDAERIAVSTGRRKSKIVFGYGLDGDDTLSLPTKRVDEVLHPILASVLSVAGVTEPDESVRRTFRFSELTLAVTDKRLVKHIGSAVWDEEFEEFPYADLTDLDFEEGTVATAVVLTHGGRSERFKAPNESARAVRETLVDAVCAFHDVDSVEEFRVTAAAAAEAEAEAGTAVTGGTTDFGEGPDPLSASPAADAEADADTGVDAEPATDAGAGASSEAGRGSNAGSGTDTEGVASTEASAASTPGRGSSKSTGTGSASPDDGAGFRTHASTDTPPETGGSGATPHTTEGETGESDASPDASAADGAATADSAEPADTTGSTTEDAFDESPFESAGVQEGDLATEVASLRETVRAQSERLDRQAELIERLIEELRRGR